jgi:hypothetical protein
VYKKILIIALMITSLTGTANAMNLKLSEHFYQKEFTCHCGCGETKIDMMLIIKLEELRTALGNKSMTITSGYRCPVHNKGCGGVKRSQHMLGKAADIKVEGLSPSYIGKKARELGFSFVKVYSGWVHVDVR